MPEEQTETLLRALVQLVGRQTFPEADLRQIVAPPGAGAKQLRAYNLCDGTRTQAEVAKKIGIDSGNFSRTVSRWIEAGIIVATGVGRERRLMHIYPLSARPASRKTGGK